ncbi:DUF928 domain-containing protein [Allocoleopsis sp.]|uniref:DUF928 domain-containing protein n=1 Tax=Allocoleopsis sp. TaxID=3088169 RepID=UPI002FD1AB4C
MAWFTRSPHFTILTLALTLGSVFPVSAQPQPNSSSLSRVFENAFQPPNRGIPDNRQGGASRGGCFSKRDQRKVTALVPLGGGETTAEYPTVFWYMPRMSDIDDDGNPGQAPAPEMEFTLRDANDQKIYSAKYPLTKYTDSSVGTPGIMSLTLASPYALKVGQVYKWQLQVTCNATGPDQSDNQSVEGVLKRVAEDPNLELRTQKASLEERIMLYTKANLWYDMLPNLVALRRDRPNDPTLTDAWNKLFTAVELEDVSIQSKLQDGRTTNN